MTHLLERSLTDLQTFPADLDGNLPGQDRTSVYSDREDQGLGKFIEDTIDVDFGSTCKLILTDGSFALVDTEDYARLCKYRWKKCGNGTGKAYVLRSTGGKKIRLHREIMGASKGQIVDHINGDPLDNRKANLRFADAYDNARNRAKCKRFKGRPTSSRYKGVYWDKSHGKYRAEITCWGKRHRLGRFPDPKDAARTYDLKAMELFGEFAWTNFDYPEKDHTEVTRCKLVETGSGREAA
jgi:hypothetical protein